MKNTVLKKGFSLILSANMVLTGMLSDFSVFAVNAETNEAADSIAAENVSLADTVINPATESVPVLSSVSYRTSGEEQDEIYRYSIKTGEKVSLGTILYESGFLADSDIDSYLERITDISVSDSDLLHLTEDEEEYDFVAEEPFDSEVEIVLTTEDGVNSSLIITNVNKTPVQAVVVDDEKTGSIAVTAAGEEHFSDDVSISVNFDENNDAFNAVKHSTVIYADYYSFFADVNEGVSGGYDVSAVFPKTVKGNGYRLFRVSEEGVNELYGDIWTTGDEADPEAAGVSFHTDELGLFVLACLKDFTYSISNEPYQVSATSDDAVSFRDVLLASSVVDEENVDVFLSCVQEVSSENPEALRVDLTEDNCFVTPDTHFETANLYFVMSDGQTGTITVTDERPYEEPAAEEIVTEETPEEEPAAEKPADEEDKSEEPAEESAVEESASAEAGIEAAVSYPDAVEINSVTIAPTEDKLLPEEAESKADVVEGEEAINTVAPEAEDPSVETVTEYKVFDIDLENVNKEEYESFDVELDISKEAAISGGNFKLYHILEDGTYEEVPVTVNMTTDENGNEVVDTITFTTPSFSDFVLVYTVESYVRTASGETWKITATFAPNSSIPSDAKLIAYEINSWDEGYTSYVERSADLIGKDASSIYARAFDISLQNPVTGEIYQPGNDTGVSIQIELTDIEIGQYEQVDVIHFPSQADTQPEKIENTINGQTVEFTTDGFSVYVITGSDGSEIPTHTYTFYVWNDEIDEYSQYGIPQTIKSGSELLVPQLPSTSEAVFVGWYEGTRDGGTGDVVLEDQSYDFDNIVITENKPIDLYAKYRKCAYVIFHDQFDPKSGTFPVASTRRGEFTSDDSENTTVKISDVTVAYTSSDSTDMAFIGWSEKPITIPGSDTDDEGNPVSSVEPDSDGCITIGEEKHLYPIFRQIHWLSFYSAKSGMSAAYVAPMSVYAYTSAQKLLPKTSRSGYRFLGWYTGTLIKNGENEYVDYGKQVTDEEGALVPSTLDEGGVYISGGELYLHNNSTLYAMWEASYSIVYWKQVPGASSETYEYAETITKTATIGSQVSLSKDDIPDDKYEGYKVGHYDSEKTIEDTKELTVLNVYYDLDSEFKPSGENHTLTFADSVEGEGTSENLPYSVPNLEYGKDLSNLIPSNPTPGRTSVSGKQIYTFSGWFRDKACTIPVDTNELRMPDENLTLYAGWLPIKFKIDIDPNYGAIAELDESGVPVGSGATYFSLTYDEEPIGEYSYIKRNYVESRSGSYYYVNHDRAFNGNDRYTYYTTNPSDATEDTTFEFAPDMYTYAGWHEVINGVEESEPYDFSKHVDHDTKLRLRWKKQGTYYIGFDAGKGTLEDGISKDAVLEEGYADNASVVLERAAIAPSGYTFIGWKVRGTDGGTVYRTGSEFKLHADDAVLISGRNIVYLDAVYVQIGTISVTYDANGGQIADNADFGMKSTIQGEVPVEAEISGDRTTATAYGLDNNTKLTLSNGTGFRYDGFALKGWSNKQNYDPADSEALFFKPGDVCGIDRQGTSVVYAVWETSVTYHLNKDRALWDGDWSDYELNPQENTYSQSVIRNTSVEEPSGMPVSNDGTLFRYWSDYARGEAQAYDFTQPVTGAMDLYAFWSNPDSIAVHAVDATGSNLTEKYASDGWEINNITVGADAAELDEDSNVSAPEKYEFAFAALHNPDDSLQSISEEDAIEAVKYDAASKQTAVKYAGSSNYVPIESGKEVYFVYYQKQQLQISYKAMDVAGDLAEVEVSGAAPKSAENLGVYNMADAINNPLGLVTPGSYTNYAFAIGKANAAAAKDLSIITDASSSETGPMLKVQNTWRGFRYTEDDQNWADCDDELALYVVYFTQLPTVVMIHEQTFGISATMNTEFSYRGSITEIHKTVTTVTTKVLQNGEWIISGEPVVTESDPSQVSTKQKTFVLKNGESNSTVLFYSETSGGTSVQEDGNTQTITSTKNVVTQTYTVEQTRLPEFTTKITGEYSSASEYICTYTADAEGGTKNITYNNTHKALPIEIHVAMVEDSGLVCRDNSNRSSTQTDYTLEVAFGDEINPLDTIFPDNLFIGDESVYAFGTIAYGRPAEEGKAIASAGLNVASVSYEQKEQNVYGLVVKDGAGNILTDLDGYDLYYLFYPMPEIRYVKEASDGSLTEITGSILDPDTGTIEPDDSITYDHRVMTMNGKTVAQHQKIEIPLEGLEIAQNGNHFRMPPVLDDGLYERYLSYVKIGVGPAAAANVSSLDISNGLHMYLEIQDNSLKYSFDGTSWKNYLESDAPAIYAVYDERGYDFEITKTIDITNSGTNPIFTDASFTVRISSTAITKDSYEAEGAESTAISATPASGTNPGFIEFIVKDGTDVKIKGLGRGDYEIREIGNDNFDLTAKIGRIVGGVPKPITVTDNNTISLAGDDSLHADTKLDLTNSPKELCKITDTEGTHIFYTLRDAVSYAEENIASGVAVIEMLTDYVMPAEDTVTISDSLNITFETAAEGFHGEGRLAVITRTEALADKTLFTNNGVMGFKNIVIYGNSVEASAPVVESSGTSLTIAAGAEIRDAKNSGNGGAVSASSGDIIIEGTLSGNSGASGGSVYYTGNGTISISGDAMIENNSADSGDGGAIYAAAGEITISENAVIQANTALNGRGGAIYVGNSSISIEQNCEILTNKAKQGGAVYAETGTVSVSESQGELAVSNNVATEGNGGALYVGSGVVTLSAGVFSGNMANKGGGGAIYTESASVTLSGEISASGNEAGNGGAIYSQNGTVTISGGAVNNNKSTTGNGGAIYSDRGSVTLSDSAELKNNTAKQDGGAVYANNSMVTVSSDRIEGNAAERNGGAIYAGSNLVSVDGTTLIGNNAGVNGGAIYASTGNVTLTGTSMTGNSAGSGNGGALYAGNSTVNVSGSSVFTGNSAAEGYGGALYLDHGSMTLNAVTATGNNSKNGAAVYVANDGSATFSAGNYIRNTATSGGAVGVGSTNTRLYFNGNVIINNNTLGTESSSPASNIYLDQDDEAVLNFDGLGNNANIGIHVPDALVESRSVPGTRFAMYTNNSNVDKIKNDRYPALTVQSDTAAKKLFWGNAIKVAVYKLASYSAGRPPKDGLTPVWSNDSYYPEFSDGAISELATELFNKYKYNIGSSVYGGAFKEGATDFNEYVTKLIWNKNESKWQLTDHRGQAIDLNNNRIEIYYADPAYISIENNTDMTLTINSMTVGGYSVIDSADVAGYGMVFAKNDKIRTALLPVTAADLTLEARQSINLLIPGGRNMDYLINGEFTTDSEKTVRLRRTGKDEEKLTVAADGTFDTPLSGKTLNEEGTYKIIFGDDRYICKVVDASGVEHPYSKISDALAAIVATSGDNPPYSLPEGEPATIEMLTDYLLPVADKVLIPRGYDIMLTTASKTEGEYRYIGDEDRATISRDSENPNSMIDAWNDAAGKDTIKALDGTTLRVANLIMDGKSVKGDSDGGAIASKYVNVYIDSVDFMNVYASNGGAMLIMFSAKDKNKKATVPGTILDVRRSKFIGCTSTTDEKSNRLGGGAIVTNAETMNLDTCEFDTCTAIDQAGAVFHRVDDNYDSWSNIKNCHFTNCSANAAGGLELDSKTIEVTGSHFEHCVAKERNGGGFNVYALNAASPSADCWVTVKDCTFNDCQLTTTNTSNGNGGGFRCNAVYTKVIDSTFTNNLALYGGGFCVSNSYAKKAEVYGCTFERNKANQGGGIFGKSKELIIGNKWIDDEDVEHTTKNTEIKNCTSNNEGAGIYHNNTGSTLTISNTTISGNRTVNNGKNGGGVYATGASSLTVIDSEISHNISTGNGGGIWFDGGNLSINGSNIDGNTANTNGGGVYQMRNADGSKLDISDTVVTGNTSNNTSNNPDQGGGGIYAGVRTMNIVNSTVSNNTAKSHGGGILFDINNNDARNGMVFTMEGCTLDSNISSKNGGGLYTRAKSVSITSYDKGEGQDPRPTIISNCTAGYCGGGIYHNRDVDGSQLSVSGATISGCVSNDTSTDNNPPRGGGGIFAYVRNVTLTNSAVTGNKAVRNGGGINASLDGSDYSLIIDHSQIKENISDYRGGGIFTRSQLTLRNNTEITGNRLTSNSSADCAGVYLTNGRTLFIGSDGIDSDTIYVRENTTANGTLSDLRLWDNGKENNASSVYVYCKNLDGEIRVVNANKEGTQFGLSAVPPQSGFDDDDPVFKADHSTLHGIIDRNDPNQVKIIWAGPPIAKITDGNGNLLYMKTTGEKGTDPAIFDRLGTGDNEYSTIAAFNALCTESPTLYKDDGKLYEGTDYCIKMLDSYVTNAPLYVMNYAGRNITFTTAGRNDSDGYPYRGTGNRAVVTRGTAVAGNISTINTEGNLALENIVIDGGSQSGVKKSSDTRCLYINNDNISVTLGENTILQNADCSGDGGGVLIRKGTLKIDGGIIRNCSAVNGGAVRSGVNNVQGNLGVVFEKGNITQCTATERGGGLDLDKGIFNLYNPIISNCTAKQGGGICVSDHIDRPLNMYGGTVIRNHATEVGGGIAVRNKNSRIFFGGTGSRRITISGNTSGRSVANGKTCNLELNLDGTNDSNKVVNVNKGGLAAGSYIGVYVPGNRDDNNPNSDTTPYREHGGKKDPFGSFADEETCKSTLYSFVNDRNGLKGGIIENPSPNTIYWIEIFSLTVRKEVIGTDLDEEFSFTVNIRGKPTVPGQLWPKDIDSSNGDYGEMTFVSNGSDTTTATFTLKQGEMKTAVNLSEGLDYEIIENLTPAQAKMYSGVPVNESFNDHGSGYDYFEPTYAKAKGIGENKGRTDVDPYNSIVAFNNTNPVCKITDSNGNLLYKKVVIKDKVTDESHVYYEPAVYTDLSGDDGAFKALEESLYPVNTGNPSSYSGPLQVQMLVDYTLKEALTLPSLGKNVTLTTAGKGENVRFPYRGEGTVSTINRGIGSGPLLRVEGDMTLSSIVLDGQKDIYVTNSDGGIVQVPANGKLTITDGAVLQNSATSVKGGAIYAASGSTIVMNGGKIWRNSSVQDGAGIYLASGSHLELSGSPDFGGRGTDVGGNIDDRNKNVKQITLTSERNGGKTYRKPIQDIYLEETDDAPASIVITGNLTCPPGTIWVYAETANHYETMMPFATSRFDDVDGNTYAAFRNARPDDETQCRGEMYLTGSGGSNRRWIYWSGGYDVMFVKNDGFGNGLVGAEFTLFTKKECESQDAYADAVSADTHKDSSGNTVPKGTVIFEKLPAGIYYMVETNLPDGYNNSYETDAYGNPIANKYVVLVGDAALNAQAAEIRALGLDEDAIEGQTGTGDTALKYAFFLLDSAGKARTDADIAKYGILNLSNETHKVVIRKRNDNADTPTPLVGAEFTIQRRDMSYIINDPAATDPYKFTSLQNGVLYIGELSDGYYFLHETKAPADYPKTGWFVVKVDENGAKISALYADIPEDLNAITFN